MQAILSGIPQATLSPVVLPPVSGLSLSDEIRPQQEPGQPRNLEMGWWCLDSGCESRSRQGRVLSCRPRRGRLGCSGERNRHTAALLALAPGHRTPVPGFMTIPSPHCMVRVTGHGHLQPRWVPLTFADQGHVARSPLQTEFFKPTQPLRPASCLSSWALPSPGPVALSAL